jgi:hypothetical protein
MQLFLSNPLVKGSISFKEVKKPRKSPMAATNSTKKSKI